MNRMEDILTEKTILLRDVMNPQNLMWNWVRHFGGRSTPTHIMNLPESLRFRQGIIPHPNADPERPERITERNPAERQPA